MAKEWLFNTNLSQYILFSFRTYYVVKKCGAGERNLPGVIPILGRSNQPIDRGQGVLGTDKPGCNQGVPLVGMVGTAIEMQGEHFTLELAIIINHELLEMGANLFRKVSGGLTGARLNLHAIGGERVHENRPWCNGGEANGKSCLPSPRRNPHLKIRCEKDSPKSDIVFGCQFQCMDLDSQRTILRLQTKGHRLLVSYA
jgi:hypothetical protein